VFKWVTCQTVTFRAALARHTKAIFSLERRLAISRKPIMVKHLDITFEPKSDTTSSPSTGVAADMQRPTTNLAPQNQISAEDLVRWEGDGGALKPRAEIAKEQPLTLKFAISRRASYDSPVRSNVEAMITPTPVAAVAAVPYMSRRGQADRNQERSKLQNSWRNAPAHPSDKNRGRRTMGRHGNRP
jgi:hypothetical protein